MPRMLESLGRGNAVRSLFSEDLPVPAPGSVESSKEELASLVRWLFMAQEEEQKRLSRSLHDDIGQQVTALLLALERHQNVAGSDHLVAAIELTATISRAIGDIAWRLRPATLDQLGLAAALPRFVDTWSLQSGIATQSRVEGYQSGVLPAAVELAFYRVMQEALANVAAHSRATRADVVLAASAGSIALIVEDDGVGFDTHAVPEQIHFSLVAMRERAALAGATLIVESMPDNGTSILVRYAQEKLP
jgi:two-component system, NarL family, sensor histidine kinase UhpB